MSLLGSYDRRAGSLVDLKHTPYLSVLSRGSVVYTDVETKGSAQSSCFIRSQAAGEHGAFDAVLQCCNCTTHPGSIEGIIGCK